MAAAANADVVVVEGQGALHHPGYSGVTLALLHGSCPRAMVLCHQAGRERVRVPGHRTAVEEDSQPWIPPLDELARSYELAASWVSPGRVVAVALNTFGLEECEARAAIRQAAEATGLPTTDPVRFGADPLAEAVEAQRRAGRERASLA